MPAAIGSPPGRAELSGGAGRAEEGRVHVRSCYVGDGPRRGVARETIANVFPAQLPAFISSPFGLIYGQSTGRWDVSGICHGHD